MTFNSLLPVLIVLSALLTGCLIFFTPERRHTLRRCLNFGGNLLCLLLIGVLITEVYLGEVFETRLPLVPGIDLVLHADALSLLFVSLSGLLWFLTSIYAMGYLEGTADRSRFFGFFSLCVASTLGIALAGNLITFLIFYELLTLATYPLVVHKGNAASLRAGRIYLCYTLIGGALLLTGVVWLKSLAGPLDFTATGVLSSLPELDPDLLTIIFVLLIAGLGVKAALLPFHGWLPVAMAAPAPVSALLHAVAVVKAGAFGIIRVVYDVYGVEFARDLGLTLGLAVIASVTIVYGSVRAIFQDDLKKRLAYSTVSQVSYIALGTAIAGPIATIGGLVHLVHQGLMKITLFFCAGNLAETLNITKVSQMNGVGRKMPLTMAAFSLAALGMIGVPPIAGFVSKWYLGMGAIEVEAYWVLAVLATSSVLNAIYFLPILHAAWFKPAISPEEGTGVSPTINEAPWMLLLPPLITVALAMLAGIFANAVVSPLSWAKEIAAREYSQSFMPAVASVGTTDTVMVQSSSALPLTWLAILVPIALAVSLILPVLRKHSLVLTPIAAIPALLVALMLPFDTDTTTTLFFGSVLSLDASSQILLLLASILWFIAGLYGQDYVFAESNKTRYVLCFLLCMSGSFGLILSHDLFGFISFFTLMSLAAYGLVVHSGTEDALRAGRSYIRWVIFGEVLLFSALVGLTISGEGTDLTTITLSNQPEWISWLLLFGFGIKAGLLSAHFWLPKAHPVAPVPASAVLSGLMVKAGLLGWWRFLPLGEVALMDLGAVMIGLGLAGAFISVALGLLQSNPKTLLAYSTISQMGIIATGVGVALRMPELWPALSGALLLYVVHHGLAKAALFLSVGMLPALAIQSSLRWLIGLAVLIAPLTMVGLPFTSGALAKLALKDSLDDLPWLANLLTLTAVGTTFLMLRFVELLMQQSRQTQSANMPMAITSFFALSLLVIGLTYNLPQAQAFINELFSWHAIWVASWPVILGFSLYSIYHVLWTALTTHPRTNKASLWSDKETRFRIHLEGLQRLKLHPGVSFIAILASLTLMLTVNELI